MRDLVQRLTRCAALAAACLVCLASISASARAGVGAWSRIAVTSGVREHSIVHDAVHHRLIVFGGLEASPGGGTHTNMIRVLSLNAPPVWQNIDPGGARPLPRRLHAAIYDPVRDRLIIHGGLAGEALSDVWAISLSGNSMWTQLSPAGTAPPARYGQLAVYDATRDRMLVIGGNTGTSRLNDVWALPLSGSPSWQQLAPTGAPPAVRWGHDGVFDPNADRVVLFGGTSLLSPLADTWELALSGTPAWSNITPAGTNPSGRWSHTASYDPALQRMLLFGGYNSQNSLNDVWALDLSGAPLWTPVTPAGAAPVARFGTSWEFDPPRGRLVLFGGGTSSGEMDDLWSLSLVGEPSWQLELEASAARPLWRQQHTTVYDPVDHRMWMFGGYIGGPLNEVWWLPLQGNPRWERVFPTGTAPIERREHSAVYDAARHRMIIFGGFRWDAPNPANDVWALTLGDAPAWQQLSPGPGPTPRFGHTAIADPLRDRMLVFGGSTASGVDNQVWSLSLAEGGAWSLLEPAGTPPSPRSHHSAAYDPTRDRMLVSGRTAALSSDLWSLSLSGGTTWAPVAWSHDIAPAMRSMAYDAADDRLVFYGGHDEEPPAPDDVWEFRLGATGPTPLSQDGLLPGARSAYSAMIDPVNRRMLVFGGLRIPFVADREVWSLSLGAPPVSTPPPRPTSGVQLAAPYPDPARGEVTLGFTLEQPGRVTLHIYDVTGRRVATLADGAFPAGPHTLRWERRTASGQRARAGLYFCELAADGTRLARKLVLVE